MSSLFFLKFHATLKACFTQHVTTLSFGTYNTLLGSKCCWLKKNRFHVRCEADLPWGGAHCGPRHPCEDHLLAPARTVPRAPGKHKQTKTKKRYGILFRFAVLRTTTVTLSTTRSRNPLVSTSREKMRTRKCGPDCRFRGDESFVVVNFVFLCFFIVMADNSSVDNSSKK